MLWASVAKCVGGVALRREVTGPGVGTEALRILVPSLPGRQPGCHVSGEERAGDPSWKISAKGTLGLSSQCSLEAFPGPLCVIWLLPRLASPLGKSPIKLGPEVGLFWASQAQVQ